MQNYYRYMYVNQSCEIQLQNGFFSFQNNLIDLDPFCKMDRDCWDCFGRENLRLITER